MKIDMHVHWEPGEDFVDKLVEEERRLGFDKVCLNGADWAKHADANHAVAAAMAKYPEVIIGFGFFPLGQWDAGRVRELHARGFKGLKFTRPTANYDDKLFYPIYETAEELGMVCLFHTGIVVRTPLDKQFDVNNNRHRPIYLDTIARAFPTLKMIGAHLGNPWYPEAAMACRWNPNLYWDLSGSSLKCNPPEFFGSLLWWTETSQYRDPEGRHAWEKIVYGSDVSIPMISDVLADYQRTLDALNLRPDLQAAVYGGTMAKLLGVGE
jgi:hypothetical protein